MAGWCVCVHCVRLPLVQEISDREEHLCVARKELEAREAQLVSDLETLGQRERTCEDREAALRAQIEMAEVSSGAVESERRLLETSRAVFQQKSREVSEYNEGGARNERGARRLNRKELGSVVASPRTA